MYNPVLQGSEVAWAKQALVHIGIDASADDVNKWLPRITNEKGQRQVIQERDVEEARKYLRMADPEWEYLTRAQILAYQAKCLLRSAEGRQLLRGEMRNLPEDALLQILDFRHD